MANYKRYWDLEDGERAALTHDEVEAFLAVELMERGALKPKAPEFEPLTETDLPTVDVYGITYHDGYDKPLDIVFPSADAAVQFLLLGAQIVERDYEANVHHTTPLVEPKITLRRLAAHDAVKARAAALRENKARKDRNDAAQRAYEKALEVLSNETTTIWDDWRRCRSEADQHRRVRETFAQYVGLAGGDEVVAWRFLRKAFSEEQATAAGLVAPTASAEAA